MRTHLPPVLAALLLLLALGGAAHADGFVLIRNAKAKGDTLTQDDIRAIFSGRMRSWPGGTMLTVVLGGESMDSMKWLADTFFKVSPKTLIVKVRQQVFRGEMQKPVMVASDSECATQVAATEGSIGVVAAGTTLPGGAVVIAVGK